MATPDPTTAVPFPTPPSGFGSPVLLISLWLGPDRRRLGPAPVLGAVCALHAVVSEVVQGTFAATRSGAVAQAGADPVGIAAGLGAYAALTRRST